MKKKAKGKAKKPGRPSGYSPQIAAKICEVISTSSVGLHTICKESGMPAVSSIMKWLKEHEEFSEQYARARELQADFMAGEILQIADDGSKDIVHTELGDYTNHEAINRSRLRVDARKWLASKLAPKVYGDKLDLTSEGKKIQAPVINILPLSKKEDE